MTSAMLVAIAVMDPAVSKTVDGIGRPSEAMFSSINVPSSPLSEVQ